MSTFAENLRRYREAAGLTAKDLASQIGIKYSTYSNYENQGREPNYDTLREIAAALHVSIDDLLSYQVDRLERWQGRFDGENIGYMEENGHWLLVDGSDGTTSRKAVYTKKGLIQLLEYAERLAGKQLAPVETGLICNTLRAALTQKIALEETQKKPPAK